MAVPTPTLKRAAKAERVLTPANRITPASRALPRPWNARLASQVRIRVLQIMLSFYMTLLFQRLRPRITNVFMRCFPAYPARTFHSQVLSYIRSDSAKIPNTLPPQDLKEC